MQTLHSVYPLPESWHVSPIPDEHGRLCIAVKVRCEPLREHISINELPVLSSTFLDKQNVSTAAWVVRISPTRTLAIRHTQIRLRTKASLASSAEERDKRNFDSAAV